jgi:hypothetical protein
LWYIQATWSAAADVSASHYILLIAPLLGDSFSSPRGRFFAGDGPWPSWLEGLNEVAGHLDSMRLLRLPFFTNSASRLVSKSWTIVLAAGNPLVYHLSLIRLMHQAFFRHPKLFREPVQVVFDFHSTLDH